MRLCAAAALAGAAVVLGGATNPIALDTLIGFERQGLCAATPAFERLIRSSYRSIDEDGGVAARQPAVEPRYRAALGKVRENRNEDWTSIVLPLQNARWGGLPITELRFHFPVGGDPANIDLHFRASPSELRAALKAKGIRTGREDGEISTVEMAIRRSPRNASIIVLHCSIG